ncbi:MAG: hypothetical protein PHR06_11965, partial [Candidatus Cloacimonetes bacterium]|nr:hypothetical protein [Candidatus Cloacimonadota bacterium]
RWVIVVLLLTLSILLIISSLNNGTAMEELAINTNLRMFKTDTLSTSELQESIAEQDTLTTKLPEQRKSVVNAEKSLKKRYLDSFLNYRIIEITMSTDNDRSVKLRKGNEAIELKVGESLDEYSVVSIHRTYILLENSSEQIHLNHVN